jgi:hypothetical protein
LPGKVGAGAFDATGLAAGVALVAAKDTVAAENRRAAVKVIVFMGIPGLFRANTLTPSERSIQISLVRRRDAYTE